MSEAPVCAAWTAPSLDDLAAIARVAFANLPEPFRSLAGDVAIRVDDFPDEETLDELGIENPFELSGLYTGVDRASRTSQDSMVVGSMIFLYRRPLLDEWAERGELTLEELVTHVLVHEIGHHFGLTDGDIDYIEAEE